MPSPLVPSCASAPIEAGLVGAADAFIGEERGCLLLRDEGEAGEKGEETRSAEEERSAEGEHSSGID